jgi:hypothetical protein
MPADPTPVGGLHPAVCAVREVSGQLGLWHETARAIGDREAVRLIEQFIGLIADCQDRVADAVPHVAVGDRPGWWEQTPEQVAVRSIPVERLAKAISGACGDGRQTVAALLQARAVLDRLAEGGERDG